LKGKHRLKSRKTVSQIFEEIEQSLNNDEITLELEKLIVKTDFRRLSQKEKKREAGRPLYLLRYE
jgi:hypothetical protein